MKLIYTAIFTMLLALTPASAQSPEQFDQGTIVLLVDVSSSMSNANVDLQYNSYAKVLTELTFLERVHFEVITFHSWPEIISSGSNTAAAAAFTTQTEIDEGARGATCLLSALEIVKQRLPDLPKPVVVDISGDGEPNCSQTQDLYRSLDELAAMGVVVNTLFIRTITYPYTPQDLSSPTPEQLFQLMTRNGGFSITAKGWMDFEAALFEKLVAEVAMLK